MSLLVRKLLSWTTLTTLLAAGSVAGCTDESSVDEATASSTEALLPVSELGTFTWAMAPRAALAKQAYSYSPATGRESYDPAYVHPSTFNVTFTVTSPATKTSYRFVVAAAGSPVAVLPSFTTAHAVTQPLAAGDYDVTLQARAGLTGNIVNVETIPITVRDVLIVAIGDSMSSGEGDPDQWATYRWRNTLDGSTGPVQSWPHQAAPVPWPQSEVYRRERVTPPVWMDEECHRSMNSGTARAAIEYEAADPHISVTFLDYACSGAETQHLVDVRQYPQRRAQLDSAHLDIYDGSQPARAVDHVVMSIGINNLNFSTLIADCLDPTYGGCDEYAYMATYEHLAETDAAYDKVGTAIHLLLPTVVTTHLIEYPATSTFENDADDLEACGLLDQWGNPPDNPIPGDPAIVPTNLSGHELTFLQDLGANLIALGREKALSNGWDFIGGIDDAFSARGYCSSYSRRFFNNLEEALDKQQNKKGTFHPNNFGYTAMGHIIKQAMIDSEHRYYLPGTAPISEWSHDFSNAQGWDSPASYKTIQFPDVNGDGAADVCGRDNGGIICAIADPANHRFKLASRWSTLFSTAAHGDRPETFTTIHFPDLDNDGKADICGRASDGVWCALSNGASFVGPRRWTPSFSDGLGFNDPRYYSSIGFPDVNRDGRADICGRAVDGMRCGINSVNDGGLFVPASLIGGDLAYTDQQGFGAAPDTYTSVQYVDINGDGRDDICGRYSTGFGCWIPTGTQFAQQNLAVDYANDKGWAGSPARYGTFQWGDINGDGLADLCGRKADGVYCSEGSGGHALAPARLWTFGFADYLGFDRSDRYPSFRLEDVNGDGKADACERSDHGLLCALSTGRVFLAPRLWEQNLTDANGWNELSAAGTLKFADVDRDGKPELCGRNANGISCVDIR